VWTPDRIQSSMTAHIRISWAHVIQAHLVLSCQSDLVVNVIVFVSKGALVVIHNLSDSHLRPKKLACIFMTSWRSSPKTPWREVFRMARLCASDEIMFISNLYGRRPSREQERISRTLWTRVRLSKLSPDLKGYGGCSLPDGGSRPTTLGLSATCTC
jgi:hypothetical protein